MAVGEEERKLLCDWGKPVGIFKREGLELYCRFSKETMIVPYDLGSLEEAIAFVERRRRPRRGPGRAPRI